MSFIPVFQIRSPKTLKRVFVGLACCSSLIHAEALDQEKNSPVLDWVPKEELTVAQLEECPTACRGAYIAPLMTGDDTELAPNESPIRGEADSSEFNTHLQTAQLEGDVVFTQGWRELKSDAVSIDRAKGSLSLQGNVSVREPGILMVGDRAEIDSASNQVEITQAQYLFHEQRIRGSASSIGRSPNGISIDNASYTACEPGDEAWVMYAEKIDINEETGRASAKGIRIEAAGVPIFYAPYFNFIIDDRRASGLLYPSIGQSSDDGFKYSQPFYWNIAENQDATFTPRFSSKRGSGLEVEHRILTENSYNLSSAAFFPNDDVNPEHSDNRWAAAVTHRGLFKGWGQPLHTVVDIAAVSDDDFLEDWNTDVIHADDQDIYLRQHTGVSLDLGHWSINATMTNYQSLISEDEDQYRELPRVSFNGLYGITDELSLTLNNEWARFDHSGDMLLNSATGFQLSADGTWITGERLRQKWSINWQKNWAWGFLNPELAINNLAYNLDAPLQGSADSNPSDMAIQASLDSGLLFERTTSLFGSQTRQTLEPRLYYLYRDADSQNAFPVFDTSAASASLNQLFRETSFVGGDRLEDSNQVSIGLWSRYYSDTSMREILSFGIGQTFYIDERTTHINEALHANEADPSLYAASTYARLLAQTGLDGLNDLNQNRSDIISETNWSVSESISIKGSVFWDDRASKLSQSGLEMLYQPKESNDFLKIAYTQENAAALYRDHNENGHIDSGELTNEDTVQVSLSSQWSLNEQWKMLFLWREDLERNRNLDKIVGFSYQNCCWNLSLSWRSELERVDTGSFVAENLRKDNSLVLSFEFSGLGGLGTSATSIIKNQ